MLVSYFLKIYLVIFPKILKITFSSLISKSRPEGHGAEVPVPFAYRGT